MAQQIDCREKLMQPLQVARVSEDLKREELETLPAGTKPRTSHHRSPGGERRGESKRSTIFFERAREGHRQSDEHYGTVSKATLGKPLSDGVERI